MKFEQFWQENQEKIKEQMKALYVEDKPVEKWEPKGGDWNIAGDGTPFLDDPDDGYRFFGIVRETKELAEKTAEKMRKFNRLLAYVDEMCGGYEFKHNERNYYVYKSYTYKTSDNLNWFFDYTDREEVAETVYMPANVAIELANKLNSGEVVL